MSVVFFNPETKKKEVSCTEYIEYDNLDFSIQCLVPKIGEYHLSVFVGTDGLV